MTNIKERGAIYGHLHRSFQNIIYVYIIYYYYLLLCNFPQFMCTGSKYAASLNQFAHCSSFHSVSRSVFLYQEGSLNNCLSECSSSLSSLHKMLCVSVHAGPSAALMKDSKTLEVSFFPQISSTQLNHFSLS